MCWSPHQLDALDIAWHKGMGCSTLSLGSTWQWRLITMQCTSCSCSCILNIHALYLVPLPKFLVNTWETLSWCHMELGLVKWKFDINHNGPLNMDSPFMTVWATSKPTTLPLAMVGLQEVGDNCIVCAGLKGLETPYTCKPNYRFLLSFYVNTNLNTM